MRALRLPEVQRLHPHRKHRGKHLLEGIRHRVVKVVTRFEVIEERLREALQAKGLVSSQDLWNRKMMTLVMEAMRMTGLTISIRIHLRLRELVPLRLPGAPEDRQMFPPANLPVLGS